MIAGFYPEPLSSPKLSVSHSGSVLSRCPFWRAHLYPVRPTTTSSPFHVPYLWPTSLGTVSHSSSQITQFEDAVSFRDPSSYRWVGSTTPSRKSELRFSKV